MAPQLARDGHNCRCANGSAVVGMSLMWHVLGTLGSVLPLAAVLFGLAACVLPGEDK
jgi:hypothetical protein